MSTTQISKLENKGKTTIRYWLEKYELKTKNKSRIAQIEPYFDKIALDEMPDDYIKNEQENTNYDLKSKFVLTDDVDVVIYEKNKFTEADLSLLYTLRFSIPLYEPGEYETGNMKIEIRKKI